MPDEFASSNCSIERTAGAIGMGILRMHKNNERGLRDDVYSRVHEEK
jgi:hypothetical protein